MKLSNKILIFAIGLGVLATAIVMIKLKMEVDKFRTTQTIGNKTWITTEKKLEAFTTIQIEDHFEVIWHKGSPLAKINIEENFKEFVKIEQEGDKIRIYLDSLKNYQSNGKMNVDLYSDSFDELILMNFCEFKCEDRCTTAVLSVSVMNHTHAKLNAEVDTLNFTAQDFSETKISGTAQIANIVMTDHAKLNAYGFVSDAAEVNLTNFSQARISVNSRLNAHCSDHTELKYKGDSLVTQIINREFSEVRKME